MRPRRPTDFTPLLRTTWTAPDIGGESRTTASLWSEGALAAKIPGVLSPFLSLWRLSKFNVLLESSAASCNILLGPLHLAEKGYSKSCCSDSYRGHKEVAELLLERGADVNAEGGVYGNALQAASSQGHKEVAQMLLEKGADVNARGGRYGNALCAASYGGHKETAEVFLEEGVKCQCTGWQSSPSRFLPTREAASPSPGRLGRGGGTCNPPGQRGCLQSRSWPGERK